VEIQQGSVRASVAGVHRDLDGHTSATNIAVR
jgi:hypothetical protein